MKIKKDTKKTNKLILLAMALAALVALLVYVFVCIPKQDDTAKPVNTPQTEKVKNAPPNKQQPQQQPKVESVDKNKTTNSNTDTPPPPVENNNESRKKRVDMVSSANQSGNTVFIRGGINYPVTGGTCYVNLSGPSGQSIKKNSDILPNPASTDCKTISIPTSELTPGTWTFILHYTSDEYEGSASEASFTL